MRRLSFCFKVTVRDIENFLRMLLRLGADSKFIPINSIDMHITKKAFLIYVLSEIGLIQLKTATRAYTKRETDFIMLPPDFYCYSHIKLTPNWRERAFEVLR